MVAEQLSTATIATGRWQIYQIHVGASDGETYLNSTGTHPPTSGPPDGPWYDEGTYGTFSYENRPAGVCWRPQDHLAFAAALHETGVDCTSGLSLYRQDEFFAAPSAFHVEDWRYDLASVGQSYDPEWVLQAMHTMHTDDDLDGNDYKFLTVWKSTSGTEPEQQRVQSFGVAGGQDFPGVNAVTITVDEDHSPTGTDRDVYVTHLTTGGYRSQSPIWTGVYVVEIYVNDSLTKYEWVISQPTMGVNTESGSYFLRTCPDATYTGIDDKRYVVGQPTIDSTNRRILIPYQEFTSEDLTGDGPYLYGYRRDFNGVLVISRYDDTQALTTSNKIESVLFELPNWSATESTPDGDATYYLGAVAVAWFSDLDQCIWAIVEGDQEADTPGSTTIWRVDPDGQNPTRVSELAGTMGATRTTGLWGSWPTGVVLGPGCRAEYEN